MTAELPPWAPPVDVVSAELVELLAAASELVQCAGCGLRGRWVGAVVINAEGRDVPRWCSMPKGRNAVFVGRPRSHGPWLPVA